MLTRKASAPASASRRIIALSLLAGPSVARMRTLRVRGTKMLGEVSLVAIHRRIDERAVSSTRLSMAPPIPTARAQLSNPVEAMAEGTIAADELRLLIERIERLEGEKKAIADDVKEVYAEGKARGYDTKTMRKIVALRK